MPRGATEPSTLLDTAAESAQQYQLAASGVGARTCGQAHPLEGLKALPGMRRSEQNGLFKVGSWGGLWHTVKQRIVEDCWVASPARVCLMGYR